MAARKPDLRHALKPLSNNAAPPAAVENSAPAGRAKNRHYRPSREGMENLTGYFPPAVKNQMLELSVERRKATGHKVTIQDLIAEAVNDLFAKYGKPEIAPISKNR
jgi:Antitoxin-like ribbon-helix-helix